MELRSPVFHAEGAERTERTRRTTLGVERLAPAQPSSSSRIPIRRLWGRHPTCMAPRSCSVLPPFSAPPREIRCGSSWSCGPPHPAPPHPRTPNYRPLSNPCASASTRASSPGSPTNDTLSAGIPSAPTPGGHRHLRQPEPVAVAERRADVGPWVHGARRVERHRRIHHRGDARRAHRVGELRDDLGARARERAAGRVVRHRPLEQRLALRRTSRAARRRTRGTPRSRAASPPRGIVGAAARSSCSSAFAVGAGEFGIDGDVAARRRRGGERVAVVHARDGGRERLDHRAGGAQVGPPRDPTPRAPRRSSARAARARSTSPSRTPASASSRSVDERRAVPRVRERERIGRGRRPRSRRAAAPRRPTVRASGPCVSRYGHVGMTPVRGTSPNVGFIADDAGELRRNAVGAAVVGAERGERHPARDGDRRAGARAARRARAGRVVRIEHLPGVAARAVAAIGEVVGRRLAEHDGARGAQPRDLERVAPHRLGEEPRPLGARAGRRLPAMS